LNKLATNVPSRWSMAIIASDDELILPHRANRADGIFGNDRWELNPPVADSFDGSREGRKREQAQ
jgi:hypothetical protein